MKLNQFDYQKMAIQIKLDEEMRKQIAAEGYLFLPLALFILFSIVTVSAMNHNWEFFSLASIFNSGLAWGLILAGSFELIKKVMLDKKLKASSSDNVWRISGALERLNFTYNSDRQIFVHPEGYFDPFCAQCWDNDGPVFLSDKALKEAYGWDEYDWGFQERMDALLDNRNLLGETRGWQLEPLQIVRKRVLEGEYLDPILFDKAVGDDYLRRHTY